MNAPMHLHLVHDQAAGLRDRIRPGAVPTTTPRVISVASGKGGVGKTFLTVNLAVLAARRGQRVLIVDGDLGLGNVDVALSMRSRNTIEDVLAGRCSMREALVQGPPGVSILAAGSGIRGLVDLPAEQRGRILDELTVLQDEFDLTFVDCGAGIGETVLFFASAATTRVLTFTPEPTSLVDAYAAAKAFSEVGVPSLDVVVNCAASDEDGRATFSRLKTVVTKFLPIQLRYMGYVPRDDLVRRAVMARAPVVELAPGARASVALQVVERSIAQRAPLPTDVPATRGRISALWDRLFGTVAV